MQNAASRIGLDRRSPVKATQETPVSLPLLDAFAAAYDLAAADALTSWRPGIRGDPRTCDTMDLYRVLVPQLGPGARMAEVGVGWGRGVLYAASLFVERDWKAARVYAVDPWRGPGDPRRGYSAMHFSAAMHSLAVGAAPYEMDIIYPVRIPSPAAAGAFESGELDAVLIDGCHEYGAVMRDIAAWMRVVRAGGVLAGHDYNEQFPGVVKAADETFGSRVNSRGDCWVVSV